MYKQKSNIGDCSHRQLISNETRLDGKTYIYLGDKVS